MLQVLEQGIMVQKELESQATQLIEHCQYGLEQVEAEKLQAKITTEQIRK